MFIVIVKVLSAAIVSPFLGFENLHAGPLFAAMIAPIGTGLHDPPVTLKGEGRERTRERGVSLSDHGVLAGMVDVLLSVGERSLLVETVVDEVVGARAGRDLTGWKTNETGRQRERVASEQQDE